MLWRKVTKMQTDLWKRISNFELDDTSQLTFTDRLARENAWSHEFSVRAILEYKKFIFLVCISDQPLTPSDQVDQVWHLHLLYTQSYWKDFCGVVLEKEIHHGPTKGGISERQKFTNWYLRTLELYQEVFETSPPPDIWPNEGIRFANVNFQRIDTNNFYLIRKFFK